MEKNNKKQPIYKDKAGRFKISVWKSERAIDDKNFLMSKVVDTSKACIQYSQYNKNTNSWQTQQIWCFCNDVHNLVKLLDRIGEGEESPALN